MSRNVLIIEDNTDIRENIIEILEMEDYQIFAADNGKCGIEMARIHKPDIILCDIMMPEMDGYQVLESLHRFPETRQIPFIFLSAKSERRDLNKGMEMSAVDYLTKPFDDVALLSRYRN